MAKPIFILSAPSPNQHWECGLGPLETYHGLQAWLGWDAQLKAFGAMLSALGYLVLVTPAPEMFFTPTALQVLARGAGIAPGALADAIHIRFGGGRFGRVLRGIPNFIATAERTPAGILAPGAHPFRGQDTAPHAMRALLDLSGEAGVLKRPDGSAIANIPAPLALVHADLALPPADGARKLNLSDFAGFELATLAEFSPEPWRRGDALPASAQLRRLILSFNGQGQPRPLILLPWNLANPANCVLDLVVKAQRAMFGAEREVYMVLLPYNAARDIAAELGPALAGLKHQLGVMAPASDSPLRGDVAATSLFIGRITDIAALAVLRRLHAVAWVDRLDPEAAWVQARLAASGIRAVTLGEGGVALEEAAMIERRDEFGLRFFAGKTLPARGVDRLLGATLAGMQAALPAVETQFHHEQAPEFVKKVVECAVLKAALAGST